VGHFYELSVGRKEIHKRIWEKKIPNRELISVLAQGCIAGLISIPLVAFINNDNTNNSIVIIQ